MGNILFLQGPLGPFFSKLASKLSNLGFTTYKIGFNGGDHYYSSADYTYSYRGDLPTWERYLSQFIARNDIDAIVVYGDCRAYHRVAHKLAKRKGVQFWVFEEGYIRPNYVTFEQGGVNAESSLRIENKAVAKQLASTWGISNKKSNIHFGETFFHRMSYGIVYYLSRVALSSWLKNDGHHRPYTSFQEMRYWLSAIRRKFYYGYTQRHLTAEIVSRWKDRCYFIPLQVHCDSQIHTHSDFNSVGAFIWKAVASFAAHAPKDTVLVMKHHPMDRGFTNYKRLIERLEQRYNLKGRLIYGHEIHIPTMLRNSIGTVTVNSTVGLSSLQHGTPTITLGRANYDLPGLTTQSSLDEFWNNPEPVDREFLGYFTEAVRRHTQLNGNFYRNIDITCDAVVDALEARGMLTRVENDQGEMVLTIA